MRQGAASPEEDARARRGGFRPVWAAAAVGSVLAVGVYAIEQHAVAGGLRAREDASAASRWLGALTWLGREPASGRTSAAILHLKDGDFDAAIGALERSVEAQPDPRRLSVLVELLIREGRAEEAAARAEQLVSVAPRESRLLELGARAFESAGRADDAQRLREQARSLPVSGEADSPADAPGSRAIVY